MGGGSDRAPLAVVTGGSGGIGRAVAAALLAGGHRVLLTGRNATALDEAAGELAAGKLAASGGPAAVEVAVFDVTDEAAVAGALDGLDVDVLVNNAGWATSAPLHRTTLGDWNAILAVHATGPFLCTRAVLPGMLSRDRGRIVTVASVAGLSGARYISAYTAAKHAAIGLMRAVAAEVTGTGVTSNAVCPSYVDTPMTDRSVARISELTRRSAGEARSDLERSLPLGRFVSAGEVAAAVAYLASADAAAVNGQTIVLDGGGIFS